MLLDFDGYSADRAPGSGGQGGSTVTSGSATGGGKDPSGWWDPAFGHRTRMSIVEAPETPLTDFPVLVRLVPMRFSYPDARPDGADLRFVAADGQTLLDHEVEHWEPDGESFVWVRVPSIDAASGDDHLWVYYGNPDATAVESRAGVWKGHLGVYHLGAGTPEALDSAEGAHHGAWTDGAGAIAAGQIAAASTVDAIHSIAVTDGSDFDADPNEALTIEAWVRADGTGLDFRSILFNESDCRGWSLLMEPTGQATARLGAGLDCTSHMDYSITTPASIVLDTGGWRHVALVIDRPGGQMLLYVNGRLDGVTDIDNTGDASAGLLRIGTDWNNAHAFVGDVDEVRISSRARSAEWIGAQIRSMKDNFLAFGPVEVH